MAKRCEVCNKGPVVGRNISHAHNVTPRRFEPNLQRVRAMVNGGVQRTPRLHALPALGQGHQGRLRSRTRDRDTYAQAVSTPAAPAAIGPYSQAIRAGNLLFLSGQIPLDPATGNLVEGGIEAQTHQVFQNIGAILKAGGTSFDGVVSATVYLADMNDFAQGERDLRHLLLVARARPRHRPGRAASQRLPRRNPGHRVACDVLRRRLDAADRLQPCSPCSPARHPPRHRHSAAP